MPADTFTASSTTAVPVDRAWQRLQVPETWEAITGVDDVVLPRFDGDDLVGFDFHSTAAGRRYRGTARPGPRTEQRSLQWDIATPDLRGWVKVDLAPTDGGTGIEVTMRVESVSVMASLGFPLIAGAIAGGFQETVDTFARGLEG